MIQIRAIWRAAMSGLLAASACLSSVAQAQSYGYGYGYGYGGTYYGGYYGSGYVTPMPSLPPVPPPTASLTWSKNASSGFKLAQMTGTFSDRITTTTFTSALGKTTKVNLYTLDLAPTPTGFKGNFGSEYASSGRFDDTVTWVLSNPDAIENVNAKGGSFSLSGMRWQQAQDGSFIVSATVSGENLAHEALWDPLEIAAFTVGAANVSTSGHTLTLSNLAMTEDMMAHMSRGLGLDMEGLQYAVMRSASMNMGTLSITAQIPEPATWSLWALGLVGLAGACSQRRGRSR